MAGSGQINIRVTDAEEATIRAHAEHLGVSVSEWVRGQALIPPLPEPVRRRVAAWARGVGMESHEVVARALLRYFVEREAEAAVGRPETYSEFAFVRDGTPGDWRPEPVTEELIKEWTDLLARRLRRRDPEGDAEPPHDGPPPLADQFTVTPVEDGRDDGE